MNRSKQAFTLIELLIVVAIIGILAAIAVPNFLNAQLRAKIAGTQSDLRIMVGAMLQYHLDNGSYHRHRDTYDQQFPLTTPIPYLNGFLYDRFQQRHDIPQAAGFVNTRTFYHWIPQNTHLDLWANGRKGHPHIREILQKKHAGIVDGWGPAGIRGGPPYEASNGLMSEGGFWREVPPGSAIH